MTLGARLVIRTDATTQTGTGHVIRCLTLANEMAKSHGVCTTFLIRGVTKDLVARLTSSGHDVVELHPKSIKEGPILSNASYESWLTKPFEEDAEEVIGHLSQFNAPFLIIDHYGIDSRWEQLVAPHAGCLIVMDDLANREHQCHFLVDSSIGRTVADYQALVPPDCRLLLGERFFIIRDELVKASKSLKRDLLKGGTKRIAVSFGGVDQSDITGQFLRAVTGKEEAKRVEYHVICGALYPHYERLKDDVEESDLRVVLYRNIENVGEILATCDIAVGAGGQMALERWYLKLFSIIMPIAENQIGPARSIQDSGAGLMVGTVEQATDALEVILSEQVDASLLHRKTTLTGMEIDGRGVARICDALMRRSSGPARIMPLTQEHAILVLEWRNSAAIRRWMVNTESIATISHEEWVRTTMESDTRHAFIYEIEDEAVGFFQFEKGSAPDQCEWGFYVSPESQPGTGSRMCRAALSHIFSQSEFHQVIGVVHPENEASLRLHKRLGFKEYGTVTKPSSAEPSGRAWVRYRLKREHWERTKPESSRHG